MEERDYRERKRDLEELIGKIDDLYQSLNLDSLRAKIMLLEQETLKDDFWTNKEQAAKINSEISQMKKRIDPLGKLYAEVQEAIELMELAMKEDDEGLLNDISTQIDGYMKTFDMLETLELLSGEDDVRSAFLTVHPGAGGTESQDWASMLFRMYLRWAEKNEYTISVIDYMPGEEAGLKTATALINGDFAFGLLKSERGIHRLVRISPFDANKRRHTSFAAVEIIPEVPDDVDIEINESDLRIDTYRASGAGGQHVNKTDSAVRITHIPSGIIVQCQNERSQHKNKAFALKVLQSKLYQLKRKEMDEKKLEKMGEKKDISWGNQIRSYVFQPYTLVKDHRTGEETGSIDYVLDGEIDRFIYTYLKTLKGQQL